MSWETSSCMEGIDSSDDEAVSSFLLTMNSYESLPLPLHEKDNSSDMSDSASGLKPMDFSNIEYSDEHQKSKIHLANSSSHSKKLRRNKVVARKLTMTKFPSRKSFLALQNCNEDVNRSVVSQSSLVFDLYKRQIDPMNGNVPLPITFINVGPFHNDSTNLNKNSSFHKQDTEIDNLVDKVVVPSLLNSELGWKVSPDENQLTLNTGKSSLKVPRKRIFDLVTKKKDHYSSCQSCNYRDSIITEHIEEDLLSSMIDRNTAIAASIEASLTRVTDDDGDDEEQPISFSRKRKIDLPKSQELSAKKRKDKFVLAKQSYPKFVREKNTLFFNRAMLEAVEEKVFLESFGEKSTITKSNFLRISMEDSSDQALTTVISVKGRQDLVENVKAKLNDHVIQLIANENISRLTKGQLEIDIKLDVTKNLGAEFVKGGKQLGIFVKDFKTNGQFEKIFGKQMRSGIALMKMRQQSQGKDQNIFKLKDKNRIWNQAKESYARSKKESDKFVVANCRLERESDLSGLDIASVVLRNRKMQGIRLVDGSTLQDYRELNERIKNFHVKPVVNDPKRFNNIEPKAKTSSQTSSPEVHVNSFEKFREKMQGIYEVEFKHLKFNANGIYSIMWEEHQRLIGKDCNSNCRCPSIVPQLTFNLVNKYCANRKKSDSSWKPKEEVDLKKEVGFVRWFYPRFYQKVNDEIGGLNPLANLETLLKMWSFHKRQLRYSDMCSFECDCRSGWDFFKKELRRALPNPLKNSHRVMKPSENTSTIQEKKVVFNPSKENLGFYCCTDSNKVLLKSVNPNVRKSAGLSVGSSITSFEVIAPNSMKKTLMSHEQLRNIYDNLKAQNNNTKLALWFKCPSKPGSRNCASDWDERGTWIVKYKRDGWAGGAMTVVTEVNSADNNRALAIQPKKSSRIVPPSLKKQSRTERSTNDNGLISQLLEKLDHPRPKSKGIHDVSSREQRSTPSLNETHKASTDISTGMLDLDTRFRHENVHQGVKTSTKHIVSKNDTHSSNVLIDKKSLTNQSENAYIESVDEDLFPNDDSYEHSATQSSRASEKPEFSAYVFEDAYDEEIDEDLFPNDDSRAASVAPSKSAESNKDANDEEIDEDLFPNDDSHAASTVPSKSAESNKEYLTTYRDVSHIDPRHSKLNSILKKGASNPKKKRVAFGQNTTTLFWAPPDFGVEENLLAVLPSKEDSDFSRGIREMSLPSIINAFNADQTKDLMDFMKHVKRKRESIKNEMKNMDDMIRMKELNDLFKKYQVIDSLLKTYSKIQSTLKKASAVIRSAEIQEIITEVDTHKDEFTDRLSTIIHWFCMLKVDIGDSLEDKRILHANIVINGINLLHVAIYACSTSLFTELVRLGCSVDASTNLFMSPQEFANELYSGAKKVGEHVESYKKVVEAINNLR